MLKSTALNQNHKNHGAKMVPFAGYEMPIQYKAGIIEEHKTVRSTCGIFDVSHMGQVMFEGAEAAKFLSRITPSDFTALEPLTSKYTVMTNEHGGIVDDLIITKLTAEKFFVVINAGCAEKDIEWMKSKMPSSVKFTHLNTRALLAVQGVDAEKILQTLVAANLSQLGYMKITETTTKAGDAIFITRSGYTGEDGFEISIENSKAPEFFEKLIAAGAKPTGLGCRDSLRLEMGYPLYGHDIDDHTIPVEAGLSWVMSKDNSNFIGAEKVLAQKAAGATRKRIGMVINEKIVAREGAEIYKNGNKVGVITSGGFSPTLNLPIAMGYVTKEFGGEGEELKILVRGKEYSATVKKFPLVQPRTKK